jgi:single-strand DNA-binding protein
MLNKVILMGRITADPELKKTPSGTSVVSFSLAVERKYSKDGNRETDFINCVAWKTTAEFVARYFSKGNMIALVGELQQRSYQTQQGEKRTVYEVVASDVSFCESKRPEGTQSAPEYPAFSNSPDSAFEEISMDGTLPF